MLLFKRSIFAGPNKVQQVHGPTHSYPGHELVHRTIDSLGQV